MSAQRRFTAEEIEIILAHPPSVACKMINRTNGVIRSQLYKLRQEPGERDGTPFTPAEDAIMRTHYSTSNADEMRRRLPGRSVLCIIERAKRLKLRKIFLGTSRKIPVEGHMELYDQIAVYARRAGISMTALDRELGTGQHFRKWTERKRANLFAIAKAVEFFGGKLVIDWNDR